MQISKSSVQWFIRVRENVQIKKSRIPMASVFQELAKAPTRAVRSLPSGSPSRIVTLGMRPKEIKVRARSTAGRHSSRRSPDSPPGFGFAEPKGNRQVGTECRTNTVSARVSQARKSTATLWRLEGRSGDLVYSRVRHGDRTARTTPRSWT